MKQRALIYTKHTAAIALAVAMLPAGATQVKNQVGPVTGHPPVAAPVPDRTTMSPGDTVTVSSGFSDPDADPEDNTAAGTGYQWMRESAPTSGTYEPVDGATGKTYTALTADDGKQLKVVVTPRTAAANTDPSEGAPVTSAAVLVTGVADVTTSTLAVGTAQANNTITADDGTSPDVSTVATLTLTLKSAQSVPVVGKSVAFIVTPAAPGTKITAVTPGANGTYTAHLTATKAQAYTVTPMVDAQEFGPGTPALTGHLTVVAAAVDGHVSTVDVPVNAALEGTSLTVNVHPRDRFANPVAVDAANINVTASDPGGLKLQKSTGISGPDAGIAMVFTPIKVDDPTRRNTIKVSAGGVLFESQDIPLRWTPILMTQVAGNRTACDTDDAEACAMWYGGALAMSYRNAGGGGKQIEMRNAEKDANFKFVETETWRVEGFVANGKPGGVVSLGTVHDMITGVDQPYKFRAAHVLAYTYWAWNPEDNDAALVSENAHDMCRQQKPAQAFRELWPTQAAAYINHALDAKYINVEGGQPDTPGSDIITHWGTKQTNVEAGFPARIRTYFYAVPQASTTSVTAVQWNSTETLIRLESYSTGAGSYPFGDSSKRLLGVICVYP